MNPKSIKALVIVAHPDDETLFFGGLMASDKKRDWEVVCVTDGGERRIQRAKEIKAACKMLGVYEVHFLEIPDTAGQRLNVKEIEKRLAGFDGYHEIYTHGPLGDYGNPHHQDVSLAVHRVFAHRCPVWSIATAICPEKFVTLSSEVFDIKSKVMTTVYGLEYERFLLVLPVSPVEGFVQVGLTEVVALHDFLNGSSELAREKLKSYRGLASIIESGAVTRSGDAFFAAYFQGQVA